MTTARSSIKLPIRTSTPTPDSIVEMLTTSKESSFTPVSMTVIKSDTGNSFTLSISWPEEMKKSFSDRFQIPPAPNWTLNHENILTKQQSRLWIHQTNDVQLVHTMLVNEMAPFGSDDESVNGEAPLARGAESMGVGHAFSSGAQSKGGSQAAIAQNGGINGFMGNGFGSRNSVGAFSGEHQSVNPIADSSGNLNFTGNLSAMDIANLLQSLNICSVSGRLEVADKLDEVHVFFEDGAPTHARRTRAAAGGVAIESSGDSVMLEVLTWQRGEYHFVPSLKSRERSIRKKLPTMLMEGMTLRDQLSYLRTAGIDESSPVVRINPNLTEQEFEGKIAAGAPLDVSQQKWLYQQFDGSRSPSDVANKHGLEKVVWVPLLYNLVSCDLVKALNGKLAEPTSNGATEFVLDEISVEKAGSELSRQESGFLSYPLFLHMLQMECDRAVNTRVPFALVIFELNRKTDRGLDPLSNAELRELSKRMHKMKASYDWLGHFGTLDFAIALPGKSIDTATDIAQEILKLASSKPLDSSGAPQDFKFSFGVSGMPQDGLKLTEIVTAALKRKDIKK